MKLWLKAPDSNRQCCGCEGKISPCDSCCLPISGIPPFQQPLQKKWDVYTNGVFKDKLLKYCQTGVTNTNQINPIPTIPGSFIFSEDNTKLQTVSSNSDNCLQHYIYNYANRLVSSDQISPPALHPPDIMNANNNCQFQFGLTINSGEYVKLTNVIQQPNINYDHYDQFVINGVGGPDNPYTGSRHTRFISANSEISLQTDLTNIYSGNGFFQEYYTFNATLVESGGMLNIAYNNTTYYIDNDSCTVVSTTRPKDFTIYQFAQSSTNVVAFFTNSSEIAVRSESVVFEQIYIGYQPSPPYYPNCPNIPLAQFLGLSIQNIGLESYATYKISNIKKIRKSHFPVNPPPDTETLVSSACVNVISNNAGAIQIFDKQNLPVSVLGRLRQFKFSDLP